MLLKLAPVIVTAPLARNVMFQCDTWKCFFSQ